MELPVLLKQSVFPWDQIPYDLQTLIGVDLVEKMSNATIKDVDGFSYAVLNSSISETDNEDKDNCKTTKVEFEVYDTNKVLKGGENDEFNKEKNRLTPFLTPVLMPEMQFDSYSASFIDDINKKHNPTKTTPTFQVQELQNPSQQLQHFNNDLTRHDEYMDFILKEPVNQSYLNSCLTDSRNGLADNLTSLEEIPEFLDIEAPLYSQHEVVLRRKKAPMEANQWCNTTSKLLDEKEPLINSIESNQPTKTQLEKQEYTRVTVQMQEQSINQKQSAGQIRSQTIPQKSNKVYKGSVEEIAHELSESQKVLPSSDSSVKTIAPEEIAKIIENMDPLSDIETNMFLKTTPIKQTVKMSPTTNSSLRRSGNETMDTPKIFEQSWLPNGFDLWKEKYRKLVLDEYPNANKSFINQRLIEIWCKIPDSHRNRYMREAEQIFLDYKSSTAGQYSYLNRFKNRPPKSQYGSRYKSRKKIEFDDIMDQDNGSESFDQTFTRIHKPKPIRPKHKSKKTAETKKNETSHDNERQSSEEESTIDDIVFDYTKALKETTTYNSPLSKKELKKKFGAQEHKKKQQLIQPVDEQIKDDILDFTDENAIATGFLIDIMMSTEQENNEDSDNTQHFPSNLFHSPPDVDKQENMLDVSALDDYLLGKEECTFLDDIEIQDQQDLQTEILDEGFSCPNAKSTPAKKRKRKVHAKASGAKRNTRKKRTVKS